MHEITKLLLEAPDSWLDRCVMPLICTWEGKPSAIQLLELLDRCIHGALASDTMVLVLQMFYNQALKDEGLTHEQLVPQATWRQL